VRNLLILCLTLFWTAGAALADKALYLDLAKRGWSYQLRTTMIGRDLSIPVHINGRDLAGSALCIVGEPPHPRSLEVINVFRELAQHTFGKVLTMRYAGTDVDLCGSGRTVVLRLYSGYPPNAALSADLAWMNRMYQLGLPDGRQYAAASPAMAQTFFGRRGQGTHIMVKQPARDVLDPMAQAFYASILIEELFQSFTFGMDILLFDRSASFQSKLQEMPLNVQRMPWESRGFMRALLSSNPARLCAFDIFMMHAVAQSPADQTNDPLFIDYIDRHYDALLAQASDTLADPRFARVVDRQCRPMRT
jgi:hypothetical protein